MAVHWVVYRAVTPSGWTLSIRTRVFWASVMRSVTLTSIQTAWVCNYSQAHMISYRRILEHGNTTRKVFYRATKTISWRKNALRSKTWMWKTVMVHRIRWATQRHSIWKVDKVVSLELWTPSLIHQFNFSFNFKGIFFLRTNSKQPYGEESKSNGILQSICEKLNFLGWVIENNIKIFPMLLIWWRQWN